MGRLDGKVALITGAARGMGAAHARLFVAEGAKVVLTDVLEDEGKAVAAELGENACFFKLDVTSESDWQQVVAAAEKCFGPINVLVNNAGVVMNKTIEETSLQEYMRIININQVGVFLGMKYVLPSMRKAKSGSIINIASVAGLRGMAYCSAYCSSKFAVRALTQTAALEFVPYNIRVNVIHPGAIETPMTTVDAKGVAEEFVKNVPLKRMAKPEEVSTLVLYLASDESSYCTGSEFVVDGGAMLV